MHTETKPVFLDRMLRTFGLCFCLLTVWLWPVVIVWLIRHCRRSRCANAPPIIAAMPPLPPIIGNGGEQPSADDEMSFAA